MKVRLLFSQLGFSLLEVIMAVGIFAVAASTFLPSSAGQMEISLNDGRMSKGLVAARNKMTEIEAEIDAGLEKNKFPDKEEKTGKFEEPYDDYSWEYVIRKVEIPMPSSPEASNPMVKGIMQTILKDISKAVREVKLTVRWWDDEDEEADRAKKEIILTTHVVNFKQK